MWRTGRSRRSESKSTGRSRDQGINHREIEKSGSKSTGRSRDQGANLYREIERSGSKSQ
jgi:hypothetical protein